MATTISGGRGQCSPPTLADPLLHLQKVSGCRSTAATASSGCQGSKNAPDHAPWLSGLDRLQPLEQDLALLPVGWGSDGKAPMLRSWSAHPGFGIAELKAAKGIRSVGARTGLLTGPLLCFDFDGETAVELGCSLGMEPWAAPTWHVHRDNDPWRLKLLFQPTLDQLTDLPGGAEFQGKTTTAPRRDTRKGEALEVFFDGGRQVILLGAHPSSGGNYIWPEGLGPEALAPPPEAWWRHALEIAATCQQRKDTGKQPSSKRNGTRRLNPCPVCGRHSGPGGSGLWCEQTADGLILCMPGSTFSAEQRHGPLNIGQVVDGWALVSRTPIAEGDVLTFKAHQQRKPSLRPTRRWRHG